LADLLGDVSLLMRVKAFYDNGLWALRDEIGWSCESVFQEDSDHGEVNNTGDILETALILGRRGYSEYFHNAERILRCHILPSQLRDTSFIQDPPNPNEEDGLRDVANRHLGAFGFPAPYGHVSVGTGRRNLSFNMDIVGGTVASLCEAYRTATEFSSTGHRVNLLFDHQTSAIQVQSPYTHKHLTIRLLKAGPLFVRIPPWIQRNEIEIEIEGTDEIPRWTDGHLFFTRPPVEQTITVKFPLKDQQLTLSELVHIHPIHVNLRGDAVASMVNFGADLTFFDTRPK
jgi:hypothetical protein